ncbi:transformer-2 protein homolog beta-like isoform X2 [Glandiceps talaboti]
MSDVEDKYDRRDRHRSKSRSPSRSRSRSPRSRSQSRSVSRSRSRSYSRSQSRSRSRSHSRSDHRRRRYSRSRSRSRSRSPRYNKRNRKRYLSPRSREYRSHSRSPMSNRRRHLGSRANPRTTECLGVFGLSLSTTERDLRDSFQRYGPLKNVNVVYDHQTGRSRGFAFVTFEAPDDANEAKERTNGMEIDGRRIRVDFSITKRAHTPTPGIYMGRPTYPKRSAYDQYDSRERGGSRHYERERGGEREPRYRRSPSPYYNRRSPSPYYRRRYSRSRSRSYSRSPRRY